MYCRENFIRCQKLGVLEKTDNFEDKTASQPITRPNLLSFVRQPKSASEKGTETQKALSLNFYMQYLLAGMQLTVRCWTPSIPQWTRNMPI